MRQFQVLIKLLRFFAPLIILYIIADLYPMHIFGGFYDLLVRRKYRPQDAYLYAFFPAFTLFALYLLFIAALGQSWYKLSNEDIGLILPKRPWKILAAAGAAPLLYAFQLLYYALWLRLNQHNWPGHSVQSDIAFHYLNYAPALLDLGYTCILSPIAEEYLDRGLIQTALKIKLGRKSAVLITAFLFVLFHYPADPIFHNPWAFLSLFGDGLFFGVLKEWDGSLWSPILAHQAYTIIRLRFCVNIG